MKFNCRMMLVVSAAAMLLGGCLGVGDDGQIEAATGATVKPVRTGVFVGKGPHGTGCCEWVRLINQSPELALTLLDSSAIAKGALDQIDVLVMPGGSSPAIKRDLGTNGTELIKNFIRKGGGYVGTCAGCCLLLDPVYDQSRGIGVIPFYRAGSKGQTTLNVKFTEKGAQALGVKSGSKMGLRYSLGPILEPSTNSFPEAKFEVWAVNDGDFMQPGRKPEMYERAAIIGGTFGKGKVVVTSCHPEYFAYSRVLIQSAFKYVTGKPMTLPTRPRRFRAPVIGFFSDSVYGVETAETLLAIDRDATLDLMPVSEKEMLQGRVEHLDALVFPQGYREKLGKDAAVLVEQFVQRGGKVYAWGNGVVNLPKGGRECKSSAELLVELRKLK